VTLVETAERLYALAPEDFTAARDEAVRQARAAGDRALAREVGALRRPTVPAWLLNALARAEPDLLAQLLDLGPALAEAQAAGHGDALRSLGAQRRALVAAVADRAVALSARTVSSGQRAEVEATLEAALADPASAAAVRSGRLVRSLSYAGLGEVDLADAVALPDRPREHGQDGAADQPDAGPGAGEQAAARARALAVARAEAAALAAAGALDDAVRACEAAERDRARSTDAVQVADAAVDAAEAALAEVRAQRDAAAAQAELATERAAAALRQARTAQEHASAARAELDRLRRD
jgi:hypothetical protein